MKAEFSDVEKLKEWIENTVNADKYDLYYETLERRLYAIKNVSTAPRIHAYVCGVDINQAGDLGKELGRPTTPVKRFDWKHENTRSDTE